MKYTKITFGNPNLSTPLTPLNGRHSSFISATPKKNMELEKLAHTKELHLKDNSRNKSVNFHRSEQRKQLFVWSTKNLKWFVFGIVLWSSIRLWKKKLSPEKYFKLCCQTENFHFHYIFGTFFHHSHFGSHWNCSQIHWIHWILLSTPIWCLQTECKQCDSIGFCMDSWAQMVSICL